MILKMKVKSNWNTRYHLFLFINTKYNKLSKTSIQVLSCKAYVTINQSNGKTKGRCLTDRKSAHMIQLINIKLMIEKSLCSVHKGNSSVVEMCDENFKLNYEMLKVLTDIERQ